MPTRDQSIFATRQRPRQIFPQNAIAPLLECGGSPPLSGGIREHLTPPLHPPHIEVVTTVLAKDVEDFLQQQLKAGDPQPKPLTVTPDLEAWLLEAAHKPATPLTAGDFTAIRQRARLRVKSPVT